MKWGMCALGFAAGFVAVVSSARKPARQDAGATDDNLGAPPRPDEFPAPPPPPPAVLDESAPLEGDCLLFLPGSAVGGPTALAFKAGEARIQRGYAQPRAEGEASIATWFKHPEKGWQYSVRSGGGFEEVVLWGVNPPDGFVAYRGRGPRGIGVRDSLHGLRAKLGGETAVEGDVHDFALESVRVRVELEQGLVHKITLSSSGGAYAGATTDHCPFPVHAPAPPPAPETLGPPVDGDCLLFALSRGSLDWPMFDLYKSLGRNYEIADSPGGGKHNRWAERGVTIERGGDGRVRSIALGSAFTGRWPHGLKIGDGIGALRKKLGYEEAPAEGDTDATPRRFLVAGIEYRVTLDAAGHASALELWTVNDLAYSGPSADKCVFATKVNPKLALSTRSRSAPPVMSFAAEPAIALGGNLDSNPNCYLTMLGATVDSAQGQALLENMGDDYRRTSKADTILRWEGDGFEAAFVAGSAHLEIRRITFFGDVNKLHKRYADPLPLGLAFGDTLDDLRAKLTRFGYVNAGLGPTWTVDRFKVRARLDDSDKLVEVNVLDETEEGPLSGCELVAPASRLTVQWTRGL